MFHLYVLQHPLFVGANFKAQDSHNTYGGFAFFDTRPIVVLLMDTQKLFISRN